MLENKEPKQIVRIFVIDEWSPVITSTQMKSFDLDKN